MIHSSDTHLIGGCIEWITILNDQAAIIRGIEEQGDSLEGLQAYRSFLSGSDLNSFFRFSAFYATFLTRELAAE